MNQDAISKDRIDPVLSGLFILPSSPGGEPHLLASRCNRCSAYFFPKRVICPNCFDEDTLEEVFLSNVGTIYTYCVVKAAPKGFDSPYILGYVDLPEGVRIFSMIESEDPETLKVGDKVRLKVGRIRRDENNNDIYGFKFEVAAN